MALIDLDKFVASFITEMKECSQMRNFSIPRCIKKALEDQGLTYHDGKIVKNQIRVSAEAKENGYRESEDEEIVKLANEYYDKVLLKECDMEEKDAHHCRLSFIHGAKAMLEKQWRKHAWTKTYDEEFEIAINALKGAGQYDSAAWLITIKQRIGG